MTETPDQNLWRGIVQQAIRDSLDLHADALQWLMCDSADLDTVLMWAKMDIEPIRRGLRAAVPLYLAAARNGVTPAKDTSRSSGRKFKWKRMTGRDFRARLESFAASSPLLSLLAGDAEPDPDAAMRQIQDRVMVYKAEAWEESNRNRPRKSARAEW